LVKQRSEAGQNLEYSTDKGADHLSIMAPGSPVVADLLSWSVARLDGEPQGAGLQEDLGVRPLRRHDGWSWSQHQSDSTA